MATVYFSAESDPKLVTIQPMFDDKLSLPTENMPAPPQATYSPAVQQMINSGQFDPPPGNTDKHYSIANPFAHTTQATASAQTQSIVSNPQDQQSGTMLIASRSAPINTAVIQQANQPITSPPVINQANTQAGTQRTEFESPPGIGSAIGSK